MSLELVVVDIDGVMTDGTFQYSTEGKVLKTFGPDDADALKLLRAEVEVVFVSADKRGLPISAKRVVEDMGYELHEVPGATRVDWMAQRAPLEPVAYIGDSFTDIAALRAVGVGITTSDALPGVQRAADYVCGRPGARRAVAEACFFLLTEHLGKPEWAEVL